MNQELTTEDLEMLYEMETELIKSCDCEVRCINCGKIVMYANPTNFEGLQLPDMICLECKNKI